MNKSIECRVNNISDDAGARLNRQSRPRTGLEYKLFRFLKAIHVTGLGPVAISKLAHSGKINDIADLYLVPDMEELISSEAGIANKKRTQDIAQQIKSNISIDFLEVLEAVSPKQITKHHFLEVIREFGCIESAASVDTYDFMWRIIKAPGIGKHKAKLLAQLIRDREFKKNYTTLRQLAILF